MYRAALIIHTSARGSTQMAYFTGLATLCKFDLFATYGNTVACHLWPLCVTAFPGVPVQHLLHPVLVLHMGNIMGFASPEPAFVAVLSRQKGN